MLKLLEFVWCMYGIQCMYRIQCCRSSKWFFPFRKWVNVNTTYKFLDEGTSHLIKVRSEILTAVFLKIQVFWDLTVYLWVSSCNCVLVHSCSIILQKTWMFHMRIMLYNSGCCFLVLAPCNVVGWYWHFGHACNPQFHGWKNQIHMDAKVAKDVVCCKESGCLQIWEWEKGYSMSCSAG